MYYSYLRLLYPITASPARTYFGSGLAVRGVDRVYFILVLSALRRSSVLSSRLRMRMLLGVTSTSSSDPIYSMHLSSDMSVGGVSRTAMSDVDERMLVRCLVLQILTSRSVSRACLPTIIPS